MFTQIRHRLLLSYLTVLTTILTLFAISVRVTFARSLDQQLIARLETLATAAALELELDGGELEVDEEIVVNANQGAQWFDIEGTLLAEQGDYALHLPFNPGRSIQTQITPHPAMSLTLPVNDYDTGVFIGYTRVSESTLAINNTLRSLDRGLWGGVVGALALTGLGGIWLTRQALQPIEQSFRRLQRFTSDASHELRTPLMAIRTNAAVALKYPKDMRVSDAEKFQAIQSASMQMSALTEDLLLLARMDQTASLKQDVVNLRGIVEHLLQLYQLDAEAKQVQLKGHLQEDLYVKGDAVQLTRLLTNLINNALRYTPEGGIVKILGKREASHLTLSVADTGIGIAPEHLVHIFERFWQVDQARSYQVGGFGLGLAISQGIAQKHGGRITVTSELGWGSCFTVCLPAIVESQERWLWRPHEMSNEV